MRSISERAYRYTPPPKRQRSGTALCLSGGGYRAALFHPEPSCHNPGDGIGKEDCGK
jgi:hypothetical protein